MGLRINTNVQSLFAQRHLGASVAEVANRSEKLASGFRINKAADDAAGLGISEKLKSQIRSINQARRNASDGISLVQTAEGGLNEITNIVTRLRELTVQAASDTIGPLERGFLQDEFSALKDEVDRISFAADYNGTKLLIGETPVPEAMLRNHNRPPLELQIGPNYAPGIDSLEIENPVNIIRIDLRKFNSLTEGPGSLEIGSSKNPDGTRVDSKEMAQLSMGKLDDALERINGYRASLGAIQNRLNSTISNLGVQSENLETAKSRIKDADFAEESAALTKANVQQQAGISVLTQVNQFPNLALKLLQ